MRQDQRGVIAILTVIGITLVIAVAGYAAIAVLQANKETKDPRKKTTTQSTDKKEEKQDDGDPNTNEYRNQGLGLEFSYPKDWSIATAGRIERYTFRLVASGETLSYDINTGKWLKKNKKDVYDVPLIKFSNNLKVFDFGAAGGDGDPVCQETNLILLSKGQVLSVFIPKACPDALAKEGDYKKSQRDKELETFLNSIKEI